ncbi:hypothetical protein [Azospirillum endophyticum]
MLYVDHFTHNTSLSIGWTMENYNTILIKHLRIR